MKIFLSIIFCVATLLSNAQKTKTKILLIGTFHFNNPGLDARKEPDFDILNPLVQKELDVISEKIKAFNPSKFFIEFDYDEQERLDSLYNLYLENKYFEYVKKKYPKSRYYAQCEIFQLAFRVGKLSNLKTIHCIDYSNADFPYDSLKQEMTHAKQLDLIKQMETFPPNAIHKNLLPRLYDLNTSQSRKENRSWYIKYANRGAMLHNFVGAYLSSEWYRRNLFMFSLIQKLTSTKDENVVLLLGAGHIALIEQFIKDDDRFEIIELKEIMEKK